MVEIIRAEIFYSSIYKKVFSLYWLISLSKQASQCARDTRRKTREEKEE